MTILSKRRADSGQTGPEGRDAVNPLNRHCLGRLYGGCRDWAHCRFCSPLEQALRAVPRGVVDF